MSDTNIDTSQPHTEDFAIDVINIALKIYHETNDDPGLRVPEKVLEAIEKITPEIKLLINRVAQNKENI